MKSISHAISNLNALVLKRLEQHNLFEYEEWAAANTQMQAETARWQLRMWTALSGEYDHNICNVNAASFFFRQQ